MIKQSIVNINKRKTCHYSSRRINYDENGNIISEIDSEGYEEHMKYDSRNNMIYRKVISPKKVFEEWNDYDENNNLIHWKDTNGVECWYQYDEQGRIIFLERLETI